MGFTAQSRKNIAKRNWKKAFVIVLAFLFLFPFLVIFINSFMSPEEVLEVFGEGKKEGFQLLPSQISLMSYYQVYLATPRYLIKFCKSLAVVLLILGGQMVTSCMGAAAFSYYKFKGSNFFLGSLIFLHFFQSRRP